MQNNSSYLALDVGGRRIGVAVASSVALLPSPSVTLEQSDTIFDELNKIINEENVGIIIVGYPRGLSGQETQQTIDTEKFVEKLKQQVSLPIVFQDEALTSKYAKDELESRGKPYGKGDIDALAATYILQDYLNENKDK